jgi:pilus assembly protein FimV
MRKFTQKALSLLTLACLGSQAHAVGLGNIEVSSKLNQPLNARIKLMSIPRQDMQNLGNIKVRLASAEAFKRAGLERPVVLSNLKFSVESSGDTSADIRISSSQPLKEPFVNFLLEVDWPNGRILREYTVLLDPPLYKAESPAPVAAPKTKAVESEGDAPAPVKSKKAITSRPAAAPLPEDVPVTGETYTVKRGDSLAGIANKMRSGSGTTQREMMQAIFDANPDAFINRNINRLRSGVVLQTPALSGDAADQNAVTITNKAQLNTYQEQTADTPEAAPITTAPAPKKAPPRPKPAAIKRPLEISGASDEGSGSGSKGDPSGDLSRKLQEITEENKRIQQENKALKEDLAATKQLVESMKNQIDALIKVQNDTLARLEQQTKGGQTAGATVAAITPKIEPPKTELKSDTSKTPDPTAKTGETKPADVKKDDWGDKPKTETKSDTSKTPDTVAKTDAKPADAKKDDWNADSSKPKTETKSDSWNEEPKKADVKTDVAQVTDPAKKPEETPKPAETPKVDAPKPADADKPKPTPVVTKPAQPPEEVGILDSALIMASDVGNMADNAVSAVPGGWMTVGGGLGVPLLAGLGWGAYRRRRDEKQAQNEELTEEELDELLQEGKDEFSDRELNLDDSFTELDGETPAFIASDEILDEVDVYVEYERYEQALETLNHALEQRPNHEPYLIKRLEIDAATGNTQAFEEHAQALHQVSGDNGDNWKKAQFLWSGISNKPLNIKESSLAEKTEKDSGGMGFGTMAAVGLGAAGLAAAGLAAAGAFGGGDGNSEGGGASADDFDSLNLNSLEEDGGELDFSSLDASDASDLDFNLSSSDDEQPQTLDMDSLNLGDDTASAESMNFDQDFNLDEANSNDDMNFLLNQDDSQDLNLHEETTADSLDLNLDSPASEEMDLSMNLDEDMSLADFNLEETPISEPSATSSPAQEEDMSFLLDDGGLDLNISEETPVAELKSSEPEKTAEVDLSLGDDFLLDDAGLDLNSLDEPTQETPVSQPEKPAEVDLSLGDDFLLDDAGLDLNSLDEPAQETPVSQSEKPAEVDLSLGDDFLLDDAGLDLSSLDEPTQETPVSQSEQPAEVDLSLGDNFLLDDAGLDLSSLEEEPTAISLEETHGGGEEIALHKNFIDDAGIEDFGNELMGETPEEPILESEPTLENELALDESFNMDMGSDLNLDNLGEEPTIETAQTHEEEFNLDDSFNSDNLSLDELNELTAEETSLETPQETLESDNFALDDSFNMDMGSDLSLDSLNEEQSTLETAQAQEEEFSLDDSFNMDLNTESTEDLSLDSLSEEMPQEEANNDFALDDSFNLDMGSLEEDNTTSLEMPSESNTEEDFKLDDDFSDFNLGLNDDTNANDGLDLSLSADEQALLGDDFNLDLNGDFNLEMGGDDIENKFDLVQMYLESDDIASAQATLEEITHLGTPDQQARAQEVLKELGL